MNTLTKEWLQNTITSIESARDEIPFGLDEDQNNMLTALKIALASLATVSDERAAYELFMEKRFGESVDRRRVKNGDREYMAWDMALGWIIWCHRAAMLQAEPVSNSDELPLDYLQGHKDGLEWAAQLAEANHPQTGDWLYDDPIDLARAIRKGPDMPTVQAGNYPVTPDGWISCSERMPAQDDWILIYSKHGEYMAGQVQGEYVELSDGTLSWLGNALYWMPLPEPPQEVN
ncbi:DUF551 domain-containing protein [Escherichia coli]|uniref:DUF551 domain-containing protein n=1 Tax=Escherichia coli TaxID=562 RepID=UPI00159B9B54|nr:DUF551 domain-containing protein [Escherichia coli]NVL68437.1 DUF551 domain-containing protein [Escherichia coli]NVL74208.1 DUF551 domain-containing protein [Escherichia coli]